MLQQAAPAGRLPQDSNDDGLTDDSVHGSNDAFLSAGSSSSTYSPPFSVQGSSSLTPSEAGDNAGDSTGGAADTGNAMDKVGAAANQTGGSNPGTSRTAPGGGPAAGAGRARSGSQTSSTTENAPFYDLLDVCVDGGGNPGTARAKSRIDSMRAFYREGLAATATAVAAAAARAAAITDEELFGGALQTRSKGPSQDLPNVTARKSKKK